MYNSTYNWFPWNTVHFYAFKYFGPNCTSLDKGSDGLNTPDLFIIKLCQNVTHSPQVLPNAALSRKHKLCDWRSRRRNILRLRGNSPALARGISIGKNPMEFIVFLCTLVYGIVSIIDATKIIVSLRLLLDVCHNLWLSNHYFLKWYLNKIIA